uniref:TF_AP-2 domain-containing protein n=1 Tax=Panagrellus redivivus TaxID=6233 RepID=A0A7E4V5V9_PANRE
MNNINNDKGPQNDDTKKKSDNNVSKEKENVNESTAPGVNNLGFSMPRDQSTPQSFPNSNPSKTIRSQMVKDFRDHTEKHFYEKDLAYESLARIKTPEERAKAIESTQCAQMAMGDVFSVLDKVVPIGDKPTDVQSTLHPKTQEKFDDYSKATQGFGLSALRVSWDACNRTLAECMKAYTDPAKFCDEIRRDLPESMEGMLRPEKTPQTSEKTPPVPHEPPVMPRNASHPVASEEESGKSTDEPTTSSTEPDQEMVEDLTPGETESPSNEPAKK